jgi:hypothetical protein
MVKAKSIKVFKGRRSELKEYPYRPLKKQTKRHKTLKGRKNFYMVFKNKPYWKSMGGY